MIDALAASPLAHAVGLALVQFLWQGTIVGGLTALSLKVLRRADARARYATACVGLAAMIVMATVAVVSDIRDARAASTQLNASQTITPMVSVGSIVGAPAAIPSGTPRAWSREGVERQLPLIALLWAAGVFVLTLHLLASWMLVERIRLRATRAAADVWRTRLPTIASALGVSRRVDVRESCLLDVPTVIGWLRPMILIPASVVGGLSPFQLEAVLAHELAHIRRHDYLVNVLQSMTETLLFYHPAVWWVSRQIRREREHCCDDLAVGVCGDRIAYARALTALEELRGATPAWAVAATGGDLLARVRRLLGVPSPAGRRSSAWVAVCAAVITASVGWPATTVTGAAVASIPQPTASPTANQTAVPQLVQTQRDRVPVAQRVVPTAETQVRDVEEQYRAARIQNDATALDRILDDAFVGTSQNGVTSDKRGTVALWRDVRITSLVVHDPNVRIAGDTAIVTGAMTEVNASGTDRMLFTHVWKKDARETWRLVSNSQFRDPRVAQPDANAAIPQNPLTSQEYRDFVSQTTNTLRALADQTGGITPAQPVREEPLAAAVGYPWPVVRVGGDIKEPRKVHDEKPVYPQVALDAKVEGIVIIEATLDTNGDVVDARVLRSQPLLDQAALDAVRHWKFTPTLLNGAPVGVIMTVTVNFTLH